MASFVCAFLALAGILPHTLGIVTRNRAPQKWESIGATAGHLDRSAVAQCSLQRHASAEMAVLRSGLDSSAEQSSCANSMDVGSKGTLYMNFLRGPPSMEPRRAVWVSGFPRSSTSTVLSMVSASQTVIDDYDGGELTFSLFEPCHDGDEYSGSLKERGCGGLLWQLTRCDFVDVDTLWGWMDPHSTHRHEKQDPFSLENATRLCTNADVVAFKTVDNGHKLPEWKWLLDETPELRIIDVVRDPRGIYASWKELEPFATLVKNGEFYSIPEVCDAFAQNIDFGHERVYHLVFEQLVSTPEKIMREAYEFMRMDFGERQLAWLADTFDATECPEPKPWEVGYTDCHTNSGDVAEKWRSVLSQEELDLFGQTKSCQHVMEHYGFAEA
eukprot:TRINITY_DN821_c0_g1_i4.p1 TRINITY_DN821_c0_g1~~TRINITY_DN821_c0_g1_i4.p1  ORF type:complete len:385 (-),score=62.05 TRINITY_DN821_c0_g1_i4:174-1328(-)